MMVTLVMLLRLLLVTMAVLDYIKQDQDPI